jgi:hypothetical protein
VVCTEGGAEVRTQAIKNEERKEHRAKKKGAIFIKVSLLSKAPAEIPPFPPLKKGGGGGFKKAISKT